MPAKHDLYRNLHTNTWSLVNRATGTVSEHPSEAFVRDVSFVVQPAGNAKVRREKKKYVHAYVRGECSPIPPMRAAAYLVHGWQRVTYNPYAHTSFVLADTGAPVYRAEAALLKADGSAWALRPVV